MVESNLIETFLYKSEDGPVSIKVIIDQENETLWATQKTMANLFNKTPKNISKHLNNIFDSGELVKDEVTVNPNDSTISGIVIKINPEANTQPILYNLDAMISVGYRVNSKEATQFRKWATKILKEYMVKGFVLDMDFQAKRHKLMSMEKWAIKLDSFLEFNEYELLKDKGKISKVDAENKANLEYEQFRVIQDKEYKSDFDKMIENIKKLDE